MAQTTSLGFPNMFNIAQNEVAVLSDDVSVVNRSRLLMLTEPAELYNSPQFGVGLSRYLFQYNNENTLAMIHDRIRSQLDMYEPYVNPENTKFLDGLLYSPDPDREAGIQQYNKLKMTVQLETTYSNTANVIFENDAKEVTYNG